MQGCLWLCSGHSKQSARCLKGKVFLYFSYTCVTRRMPSERRGERILISADDTATGDRGCHNKLKMSRVCRAVHCHCVCSVISTSPSVPSVILFEGQAGMPSSGASPSIFLCSLVGHVLKNHISVACNFPIAFMVITI